MNKQELIDKGISEVRGIWPIVRKGVNVAGLYKSDTGVFDKSDSGKYGYSGWDVSKEEFQQRAKELGWINGYKWGVEYPTNGKKPDLPDGVRVSVKFDSKYLDFGNEHNAVENWTWDFSKEFRIIDGRYKPIEATPEVAPVSAKPITNFDDCSIEMVEDWYCYEQQKAIALPPVGVECETQGKSSVGYRSFCKVRIIHHGVSNTALIALTDLSDCLAGDALVFKTKELEFRPLDHTTRTKELEKKRVVDAVYNTLPESEVATRALAHHAKQILNHLYDNGYLNHSETNKEGINNGL
jgi:hypothetical protein